jgi:hypothetical protein
VTGNPVTENDLRLENEKLKARIEEMKQYGISRINAMGSKEEHIVYLQCALADARADVEGWIKKYKAITLLAKEMYEALLQLKGLLPDIEDARGTIESIIDDALAKARGRE